MVIYCDQKVVELVVDKQKYQEILDADVICISCEDKERNIYCKISYVDGDEDII